MSSPFIPPVLVSISISHLPSLPHEVLEVLPINQSIRTGSAHGGGGQSTDVSLSFATSPQHGGDWPSGEAWGSKGVMGMGSATASAADGPSPPPPPPWMSTASPVVAA